MHKFSIIIPVYNRPEELQELLESLVTQTTKNFEVIIVEDGSSQKCNYVAEKYEKLLDVKYFYKDNSGPGLSRNYGAEMASSDFFVFLDSDCILPEDYFKNLTYYLKFGNVDCYGGPDRAHASFTDVQKAISYSMTSFLTTGGIRGGKKKVIKFHPRSFNMGFSREVFQKTGGFGGMRFGEDIDLSLRIEQSGFNCMLIESTYVYHKRRTDFMKFFKQIFNSGIARINLFKLHPHSLKATHFAPAVLLIFFFTSILAMIFFTFPWLLLLSGFYLFAILIDATRQSKSLYLGALSVIASMVQIIAYGSGFILAFLSRIIFRKKEFSAFEKNFYK